MTLQLEEIIGTGDCLVSVHRTRARAKDVDIELSEPLAYVWTFREGRIIHFRSIRDRAEALEVAGLQD
jgi:ketosteroid isomerase-like protein